MEPRRRLRHVDGLRAVAALWVVFYHCYVCFYEKAVGPKGPWLWLMSWGHLGVPMFLVISGFCLAMPFLAAGTALVDILAFLRRRALRILPPYYLVMGTLAALFQIPALQELSGQEPIGLRDVLTHFFMIHNVLGDHIFRISGPFWSIALEWQFYLVFPGLMLGMRFPRLAGAAVLLVACYSWVTAPADVAWAWRFVNWHASFSLAPIFFLGMLAAHVVVSGFQGSAWVSWGGVAFILGGLLASPEVGPSRLVAQLCTAIGTALLLMCEGEGVIMRNLSRRWLGIVGMVSYTLYLIHMPILSLVSKLLGGRLSGLALHATSVALVVLILIVAVFAYFVIEYPFHKLSRRWGPIPLYDRDL